ncbi:hypothetical protein GS676_24315 [Rhodococcus hoagii]|nr:hypothetical protein [Prescottella equi]
MAEMITAAQAAQILGVTDARVRQLTADARLTGHVYGPRVVLYDLAEIEVYRRATGGAEVTSGVAATAPAVETPLRADVNEVLYVPGGWGEEDQPVHVRIWSSPQRKVVLITEVAHSLISLQGWQFRDRILPAISERYLAGDYLDPFWFTLSDSSDQFLIMNPVVSVREPDYTRRLGWKSLWTSRRDVADPKAAVNVAAITLERDGVGTIDRLIGSKVHLFPESDLATAENIRRHREAMGSPIDVTIDVPRVRATANAMCTIDASRATDPVTADTALRVLANRIDTILGMPEHFRVPNWMRYFEYDDARRDGFTADHCAVSPTMDNLADIDWRAIAEPCDLTADQLRACWSGLGAWLDSVDDHAPGAARDAGLGEALGAAMDEIHRVYRVRQDTDATIRPLSPYPSSVPRAYEVTSVTDEFWNQCGAGAAESTDLRRLMQHLDRLLGDEGDGKYEVRTAPDGSPVARYTWESRAREDIVIMWPYLTPPFERIPGGSRIVSTCQGDAAVFVQRPDGALAPLPRPANMNPHSGWSYGYSGSGPATLAAALAEVLDASDGIEPTPRRRRRIDELLTNSSEAQLDLPIETIRAAVAGDPGDSSSA